MCLASQTKSCTRCSDRRSLICSSQGSMLVTSRFLIIVHVDRTAWVRRWTATHLGHCMHGA
jgi:hypothetical protein